MSKNSVSEAAWVIRVILKDSSGEKEVKYWFGPNRNHGKAFGSVDQAKRFNSRSEARTEAKKILPAVLPDGASSTAIKFSDVQEVETPIESAAKKIMKAHKDSSSNSNPEDTVYIRLARELLKQGVVF